MTTEPPDPTKTLNKLRAIGEELEAMRAAHVPAPQADRVLTKLHTAIGGVEVAILALESIARPTP